MSFKTASALLRGAWLIEPGFAQAHLPLVQRLVQGDFEGFEYKEGKESKTYAVNTFKARSTWSDFNDAPKGSIAVVLVNGPILKHDNCGDPGSMTRARQIREADSHQNIDAIILDIDSPGGMVDGTQTFADAIAGTEKPIIAFINDGMSASAAYWIAAMCDEVYVSRSTDMVGSIGVYLTLADFSKYYEEAGIKIHEIYAPESSEKNLDYKEAIKGNYKLIEKELSFLAQKFIEAVKSGRGDKINLSKGDPFKGKMYFSEEAISIGLIDGIKSFDKVIERVSELAKTKNKSNSNNNSTTMNKKTYAAVNVALNTKTLEVTGEGKEQGVFLNETQMDAIEAGLTPAENAITAEAHKTVVDELATANTSVSENEASLRSMATIAGVEIAEGDFNAETVTAAIKAKITELNSGSTANHTITDTKGDADAIADEVADKLAAMPHNQIADNL
jgi:protease-4